MKNLFLICVMLFEFMKYQDTSYLIIFDGESVKYKKITKQPKELKPNEMFLNHTEAKLHANPQTFANYIVSRRLYETKSN